VAGRRKKPDPKSIDWLRVEHIQRTSFHGGGCPPHDLDYCQQALAADPERYRQIGERLREDYAASLRMRH
jgi:hypothetical protein